MRSKIVFAIFVFVVLSSFSKAEDIIASANVGVSVIISFDAINFGCAFSGQLDCPVIEYSPPSDNNFYPVEPNSLNITVSGSNFNISIQVLNPAFAERLRVAFSPTPSFTNYKTVPAAPRVLGTNLSPGTYFFDFKADSNPMVRNPVSFNFKIIIEV